MKILIEDLSFETIIGILDHERITPQSVKIECQITYEYIPPNFIDYAEVSSFIQTTMQKEKFFLIEDALETIAHRLKENFTLIQGLTLIIRKPNIMANCTVGLEKTFIF